MKRGKRDIVADVFEKARVVVGLVMRLSCVGTRRIVVRSDCIEELMILVLMIDLRGVVLSCLYTRASSFEKHRDVTRRCSIGYHTVVKVV